VERAHAERAVELAVTKYCSVRDSLDPAIPITWSIELAGA
jgi:putative redox protein